MPDRNIVIEQLKKLLIVLENDYGDDESGEIQAQINAVKDAIELLDLDERMEDDLK